MNADQKEAQTKYNKDINRSLPFIKQLKLFTHLLNSNLSV
jgi:hypothetical protein